MRDGAEFRSSSPKDLEAVMSFLGEQQFSWRLQMRDAFDLNVRPHRQLLDSNAGATLITSSAL
jgi:hypothetical protein